VRHVAPHHWADLLAGRVPEAQARDMEDHAERCRRCAAARDRVTSASGSFPALRAVEAPELEWHEVWARVYWQSSSERRSGQRPAVKRRRWPLVAAPAALAAAGLLTWHLSGPGDTAGPAARAENPASPPELAVAAAAPVASEPLRGLVTFLQGEVFLADGPLPFDAAITAGTRLRTGAGRLTVQFGDGTGFTLGPDSSVELRAFDRAAVELVVEGALSLEVSQREPGQRFSVRAGHREVLVRGTAFRVDHRAGALEVACSHGRVVVADGDTRRPVDAGYRLRVEPGAELLAAVLEELAEARRHVLQGSPTMPLLVAWTEPETLDATSAMLEVRSAGSGPVTVDGIEVASGSFRMRVMSGRHRVEPAGATGRGTWVEARPGVVGQAALEAPPPPARDHGVPARRARLRKALSDSSAVRGCLTPLEKQGLVEGSYLVLELGVEADGTLSHLNVGATNMPRSVASCLRDVANGVEFAAGAAADFEYRLEL
jgi:hypothetical protein